MFFVIEVIIASIVVSALAYALRLVPKYPKRFHRMLVQVLNTAFLTMLLTYLIANGIEPGFVLLGSMIFGCLFLAVIITNTAAKNTSSKTPPPLP